MDLPPEKIYPRVGIGVMVMKGNNVLLGKRKGSHGEGQYAWPGGHMEYIATAIFQNEKPPSGNEGKWATGSGSSKEEKAMAVLHLS
jgi:ADP-ribose pyrophosphatase YjhB (NUDIX family)